MHLSYPNIAPSYYLNFESTGKAPPHLAVTRSGEAYVTQSGVIKKVKDNSPIIGNNGLILSKAITNHAINTHGSDVTIWNTTTALGQPSPAKTNDAVLVKEDSTVNTHGVAFTIKSIVQGQTLCSSVYIKPVGGRRFIQLRWWSGTVGISGAVANFDLETLESTVQAGNSTSGILSKGIEKLDDGWFRLWACCVVEGTANSADFGIDGIPSLDSSRRAPYQGNTNDGFYVWCPQVEVSTGVGYPVPNTTTGMLTLPTSIYRFDSGKIFDTNRGTVFVEYIQRGDVNPTLDAVLFDIGDSSSDVANTSRTAMITVGGRITVQHNKRFRMLEIDAIYNRKVRMAISIGENSGMVAIDGVVYHTEVNPMLNAVVKQVSLGVNRNTSALFNGSISQFSYYSNMLNEQELIALTS